MSRFWKDSEKILKRSWHELGTILERRIFKNLAKIFYQGMKGIFDVRFCVLFFHEKVLFTWRKENLILSVKKKFGYVTNIFCWLFILSKWVIYLPTFYFYRLNFFLPIRYCLFLIFPFVKTLNQVINGILTVIFLYIQIPWSMYWTRKLGLHYRPRIFISLYRNINSNTTGILLYEK